jgi:hypothetical protein
MVLHAAMGGRALLHRHRGALIATDCIGVRRSATDCHGWPDDDLCGCLLHQAATVFDPFGPIPGYVDHNGLQAVTRFRPNPGRDNNRVKEARGYYILRVAHRGFVDGAIAPNETRVGCVAFGQVRRRWSLMASPMASLMASLMAHCD